MRFCRPTLLILLAILFSGSVAAQDFEYGKPDELKGLSTYYVETYGDTKIRDRIVEELGKALPDLKLADEFENAQIHLIYRGTGGTLRWGAGFVGTTAKGKDKSRPRILLSFENEQDNKGETRPHNKFVKEFIKAYKKANGIK